MVKGVTLLELLVVIVLLGVVASVVGFGVVGGRVTVVDESARARRAAILSGAPVVVERWDSVAGRLVTTRWLPDGRSVMTK